MGTSLRTGANSKYTTVDSELAQSDTSLNTAFTNGMTKDQDLIGDVRRNHRRVTTGPIRPRDIEGTAEETIIPSQTREDDSCGILCKTGQVLETGGELVTTVALGTAQATVGVATGIASGVVTATLKGPAQIVRKGALLVDAPETAEWAENFTQDLDKKMRPNTPIGSIAHNATSLAVEYVAAPVLAPVKAAETTVNMGLSTVHAVKSTTDGDYLAATTSAGEVLAEALPPIPDMVRRL